jgi:hypothetical protein
MRLKQYRFIRKRWLACYSSEWGYRCWFAIVDRSMRLYSEIFLLNIGFERSEGIFSTRSCDGWLAHRLHHVRLNASSLKRLHGDEALHLCRFVKQVLLSA